MPTNISQLDLLIGVYSLYVFSLNRLEIRIVFCKGQQWWWKSSTKLRIKSNCDLLYCYCTAHLDVCESILFLRYDKRPRGLQYFCKKRKNVRYHGIRKKEILVIAIVTAIHKEAILKESKTSSQGSQRVFGMLRKIQYVGSIKIQPYLQTTHF